MNFWLITYQTRWYLLTGEFVEWNLICCNLDIQYWICSSRCIDNFWNHWLHNHATLFFQFFVHKTCKLLPQNNFHHLKWFYMIWFNFKNNIIKTSSFGKSNMSVKAYLLTCFSLKQNVSTGLMLDEFLVLTFNLTFLWCCHFYNFLLFLI